MSLAAEFKLSIEQRRARDKAIKARPADVDELCPGGLDQRADAIRRMDAARPKTRKRVKGTKGAMFVVPEVR